MVATARWACHPVAHSDGNGPLGKLFKEESTMKILVCLDGSELARSILPHARQLAQSAGAQVELVQVLDLGKIEQTLGRRLGGPTADLGAFTATGDAHVPFVPKIDHPAESEAVVEGRELAIERVRAEAQAQLVAELTGFPRRVQCTVLTGDNPAATIVQYAQDAQADLIAMATHSRSGMREAIWGSVTDSVVRSGVAPVLVYHPAQ